VTFHHFTHDRSKCSSPSFSSNTFQNFTSVCIQFSERSKIQHHADLLQIQNITSSFLNFDPSYYVTACCDDKSYGARIVQNAGLPDTHVAVCSGNVFGFLSPGNGGESGSLLSLLVVLLDSQLSLSDFEINLVKAAQITRTFHSLNATLAQSKNYPFGINTTIVLKNIKITCDNSDT
jgi:hypothetical protein